MRKDIILAVDYHQKSCVVRRLNTATGEEKVLKDLPTPAPFADFHVYAVEWSADRIDFFFDDKKYQSFPLDKAGAGPDNPFRKPHYLLINFALGGSWGGSIDDAILPQKFLVDYVRVYRQKTP